MYNNNSEWETQCNGDVFMDRFIAWVDYTTSPNSKYLQARQQYMAKHFGNIMSPDP